MVAKKNICAIAFRGIKFAVRTTLLQFSKKLMNPHLPAAITRACIVLAEDWLSPHKVKGFEILR